MMPLLNEKQRRIFLASEAMSYGYGGISTVSRISEISIPTIRQGIKEIQTGEAIENGRVRKAGGGRKRVEDIYREILEKIKEIVDGNTYGSPDKVVSWTTLSLHAIQKLLLDKYRIKVSYRTVGDLLKRPGYSKQTNQKMLQAGTPNPNRNEQFEYINNKVKEFTEAGDPVISVDTKKEENTGKFKNNGQEYRKKGEPRKVLDHDFPIPELGKVSPYGIYVITSVFKGRKEPGDGKSRTRDGDDAAIFAGMTEPYGRCLPQYRVVGQNEPKSLEHDSSIHPDCIPERRAAGKTPPFYPCAFPARPQQACRDGPSDCPGSETPSVWRHESGAP